MTRRDRPYAPAAALLALLPALAVPAAEAPPAAPPSSRQVVELLASGELDGRLTGTEGERRAAEYLAERLAELGARPLPGQEGFAVPFDFTAGARDAGTSLTVTAGDAGAEVRGGERILPLSFSDAGQASGPVVFAGYGIVVPEGQDVPYDSYAGLDVGDKVVLVLRYFPEQAPEDMRHVLSRYSGLRYKALQAREHGARALLVVTGPSSPNAGEVVPMSFDSAVSGSGLLAASLSGEVGAELFRLAGRELAAAQEALDGANPHVAGFALPGVEVALDVQVERERRVGHSVAGYLPAAGGAAAERPWVVLGAHLDHLGRGESGNSLARGEEVGGVHHGADDNASGVAAVLAAGRHLATGAALGRHVALAFFSGEELGLLGSSDFVDRPVLAPGEIAAYLNFDMVGRLGDGPLAVEAVGSSPAWPGIVERANVPVGLPLVLKDDPYLPQDSTTFNRADVPTLAFFTGGHEDYHRPSDTADKIDYEGLEEIARLGARVARQVADAGAPPEFVEVTPTRPEGTRAGIRAFTGTIPDYVWEGDGLRLSGAVGGGPAATAGLREGDVIVAMGGQKIANIYDYTYALETVKVGQPVAVVFLRDGERHEVEVTPTARD